MHYINHRFQRVGALLWVLSIQYYIVQYVVAAAWPAQRRFSWLHNTISDLGNTHCGQYGGVLVCSPRHALMNASFVLLGVTMIVGAGLLQVGQQRLIRIGSGCLAAAGVGTILVGLFPENSISALHILGAGLAFVLGNVGIIIIGTQLSQPWLKSISLIAGGVALAAAATFASGHSILIGNGGIERLAAYPQSIWMIIIGLMLIFKPKKANSINVA